MKKVLALILAVAMLATVSFAEISWVPTDSYLDPVSLGVEVPEGKEFTSEYYTFSFKWAKGKEFIESIEWEEVEYIGNCIVINFAENFTLEMPEVGKENLKLDSYKIKEKGTNNVFTEENASGMIADLIENGGRLGNYVYTLDIEDHEVDESFYDYFNYSCSILEITDEDGDDAYGTVEYEDDDVKFSVRVYEGEKFYLYCDKGADKDVLLANQDVEYDDIEFLDFVASPKFTNTMTWTICDLDKEYRIYENKDGVLTQIGTYDEENCEWVIKTKQLTKYVISTGADLVSVESAVKNPDTGANNVAGIATAMAVVALLSGAAISLKK